MSTEQLRYAMEEAGLTAPLHLELDGRLHRFNGRDKPGSDRSSWYIGFDDRFPAAAFGDWAMGLRQTWQADIGRPLTAAERAEQHKRIAEAKKRAEAEQRRQWLDNRSRNADLWKRSHPLQPGDPVSLYLKSRGFILWPLPSCLRYHHALPYWQDGQHLGNFPAMVAELVNAKGEQVALHRTYLTKQGRKADVPQVRKVTAAAGPLTGCAIRLSEMTDGHLGVGEGVETALGAHFLSGLPVWATYSAGSLAAFQFPAGLQRLTVFSDNDPPDSQGRRAGQEAAQALQARAVAAGIKASILSPTIEGTDWADVWVSQREGVAA
jgi:phage/plasmid primase-like uncharacterized protein